MRLNMIGGILVALTAFGLALRPSYAAKPEASTFRLDNGIRVVSVYFPGSPDVSIFSYFPMGLASDEAGRAEWSHLVEHMVVRSTVPVGSQEANGETMHDNMRLDTYGSVANWEGALEHHARWLEGAPFNGQDFEAEKERAASEGDFVSTKFMTHKIAFSAWDQGCRHGRDHAAVKGDLSGATLGDIRRYRDEHMVVLDQVVVCVVGGIDAATLKPVVSKRLGAVKSNAKPFALVRLSNTGRDMTWDLNARNLLITWPIPAVDDGDYPALRVGGVWLQMKVFSDPGLKGLTGVVFAGADLTVPEGNYFYLNASLRPGASFDDVRDKLYAQVQAMQSGEGPAEAAMIGAQLSYQLTTLTDPALIKAQAPANVNERMIEGNIGLQWGMSEFRYGDGRTELAKKLGSVSAEGVKKAALKYLAKEKAMVFTIHPQEATPVGKGRGER